MTASRRNVALLAASQALALSAVVLSMTLAGILGATLAPDRGLATLPIALMVVGTALASIPASMLMRRLGRRAGEARNKASRLLAASRGVHVLHEVKGGAAHAGFEAAVAAAR